MVKILTDSNGYQYKAEKVVKTGDDTVGYTVTGYTGGHEVFKFAGISDLSMYKLEDEEGNTVDYDISKEEQSQNTINSLGSQLVQAKISNMQKDILIKNLGTQITQSKLEDLQNKTINNYIGQQLVQAKLNLIKVQGGI